ncbi:hypothetical protein nbrc107696_22040 [Gordonia spumicola]|uniref:GGDEF domain-containing protein n=1 Tax=Gordonia spumicola TaxID=589161 RepID=A0A7I9V8Q1_9ACTN|nr:hypothetical protein nbrc107696_22040 [Gordonia spumicola]
MLRAMLPGRMLSPADEVRFRATFDSTARTYRSELWIALMVGMALLVVFDRAFFDAAHTLTHKPELIVVGVVLPMLLRWASSRSTRAARWSTPLYVTSVYLDVAVLLAVRVQTSDGAFESVPMLAPLAVLLSLLLVQIRFEVLVPLLLVGFAGIAVTESSRSAWTPSSQIELFAAAVVTIIPIGTVYSHERTQRTTWLVEQALYAAARTDALTGVGNRLALDEHLSEMSTADTIAVAVYDVDEFKRYNDDFGHPAGDDCLAAIGDVLASSTGARPAEFAARLSGEEFVVVWRDIPASEVVTRAEALQAAIGAIEPMGSADRPVTVSAGVVLPVDVVGRQLSDVVALADAALYSAKQSGRNRVAIAETGVARSEDRRPWTFSTAPAAERPADDIEPRGRVSDSAPRPTKPASCTSTTP